MLENINAQASFMQVVAILVPAVVAFLITVLVTSRLIPMLVKMKNTQYIHEDVPDSHVKKSGTPTMGGIGIILGVVCGSIASMVVSGFSLNMIIILCVMVVFGFLGFFDDYVKVSKKQNLGLRAKHKLALQVVIALAAACYYVFVAKLGTSILIPFVWKPIDIGYFIIPYIVFVIVAVVNAVNLTDGLDGLASGVSCALSIMFPVIVLLGFSVTLIKRGEMLMEALKFDLADSYFFIALAGACLGFLIFNRFPAKVFMGDTGSLAIGGGIASAAIFIHMELLLPICGFVFVMEALSDIIQVTSYKFRGGKRVFKMAPLHHHFELSGWHEKKVVTVFVTATLILCVAVIVIVAVQYNGMIK